MARPKEFDPDQALNRAVDVFWSKGYDATSVQNLVEALGVNRSSLYATFGDKHTLYLAALDRYRTNEVDPVVALLGRPGSARSVAATLFESLITAVRERHDRRGCLLCNAAVDEASHDAEVEALVMAGTDRIKAAFIGLLARDSGSRHVDADHRAVARFLTSSYMGLRVMIKAGHSPAALHDIVKITLSVLD